MTTHLVAGASVALIAGSQRVEVVSGVTNIMTDAPVESATQFRVASITKMYIATVAMRLVERGVLTLDEPIAQYRLDLPPELGFAHGVSLRQLLSHTTGISQTYTADEDRYRRLSRRALLARIPPPVCDPGDCWSYADGNYILIQLVIERATGQPLGAVLDAELFGPLGLDETQFVDAAAVDDVLPHQYALVTDDSGQPVEPKRLFQQALPRSGTLTTSARDAATFADALFGADLFEPATLDDMLDTSAMRDLPCPDECPFPYGLGVLHYEGTVAGREMVGHDGSSGAVVAHDREADLTIAILTNGGEQDVGAFLKGVAAAIDDATE